MNLEKPGMESEIPNNYPAEAYRNQIKNPYREQKTLQALLAELSREV
jgi:hypothetical protein